MFAPMPGDDLVDDARLMSTRAVTIQAPMERVFPWLAQIGQGRGGFYSYDWLENNPVQRLAIHSAAQILPEFQEVEVGDQIPIAPGPAFYGLVVAWVDAPRSLVLETRMHPFKGTQVDPRDDPRTPLMHGTWAFALQRTDDGATRLISRNRAAFRLPLGTGLPYRLVLEAIEFIMERGMLLGIRSRAERTPTPVDAVAADATEAVRAHAAPPT